MDTENQDPSTPIYAMSVTKQFNWSETPGFSMPKERKPSPTKYNKAVKEDFPKFSSSTRQTQSDRSPIVTKLHIRETAKLPSLVTPGGSTPARPTNQYTGDLVKGISLVHKSGFMPVFTDEQAKDFATMRR